MIHHPRNLSLFVAAAAALGQLACSTDSTVNLGETKGSALVDYAAGWDGYAEAAFFDEANTPTDRIRITVRADGTGSVRIGDAPLFPPANDYDVGYPRGAQPTVFQAGFEYSLHDVKVEGRRLRFYLEPSEPFADWCSHQTPFVESENVVRCVPGGVIADEGGNCSIGYPGDDVATAPIVDCGKATLCVAPDVLCKCTPSACGPDHDPQFRIRFDGSLEEAGSRLVGAIGRTAPVTVKLDRQ